METEKKPSPGLSQCLEIWDKKKKTTKETEQEGSGTYEKNKSKLMFWRLREERIWRKKDRHLLQKLLTG